MYAAVMFLLGPGVVLYGFRVISRKQIRLTTRKNLSGESAVFVGIFVVIAGTVFTLFLWKMGSYLPH